MKLAVALLVLLASIGVAMSQGSKGVVEKFDAAVYNYADFLASRNEFRWDPFLDRRKSDIDVLRDKALQASPEGVALADAFVNRMLNSSRAKPNGDISKVDQCRKYETPTSKYSSHCFINLLTSTRYSNSLIWPFKELIKKTCGAGFSSNDSCVRFHRRFVGHMLELTRLKEYLASIQDQPCLAQCRKDQKRVRELKIWTDDNWLNVSQAVKDSLPSLSVTLRANCSSNEIFRNSPDKKIDAAHAATSELMCFNRILSIIWNRNKALRKFDWDLNALCAPTSEPWRCRRRIRVYQYYALKRRVRSYIRFLNTYLTRRPFHLKV